MVLVVLLLLFSPVTSKLDQESGCLRQIKCSEVSPRCLRVKRNQNIIHIVVFNQCEIQRIKCSEGKDATVVPMSYCHYGNETRYLRSSNETNTKNRPKRQTPTESLPDRDSYQRGMGFMIDVSLYDRNRTIETMINDTVKQIAEEAAKYYDVTFYAFSATSFDSDLMYKSGPYKNLTQFLIQFAYYARTRIHYDYKKDYCHGRILTAIQEAATMDSSTDSYLYVFTHNLAKDYTELAKGWPKKNVKVTVVLLPDCLDRERYNEPEFEVFYDLAVLTRGQLLMLRYNSDVEQLKEYVRHTALAFQPKVLFCKKISPNGTNIPFKVEESVVYVVISVCGSNVDVAITDDLGNGIIPQVLINRTHSAVYRFVAFPPYSYVARVDQSVHPYGKWNVIVNIMSSKVDFTFTYRESKERKWRDSLRNLDNDDDFKKPKYLIIKVTDKRDLVDVKKIKFIELDEEDQDVFATHTLTEVAENVFATKYKISTPTRSFVMVASGILKGTTKALDSGEVIYKPSNHQETSSEEIKGDQLKLKSNTTTTSSSFPEKLLGTGGKNKWDNQTLLRWKQFRGSCPKQCPVRDVMVCARCQHGVQSTFMSDCHMRMFQCKYPRDKLILVARRPCMDSGPFLGDMPRPEERLAEPDDEDRVSAHIHDRRGDRHPLAKAKSNMS